MLEIESLAALECENSINQKLKDLIQEGRSFVFDAGAGAGKTFSLVECLRYVISTNQRVMGKRGQKVVCITFTNVAANEVSERLGASEMAIVSTIHDFLWPFISVHKKELAEIHREKLIEEINAKQEELTTNDNFRVYAELSPENKVHFEETLLAKADEYEKLHYSDPAAGSFKEEVKALLGKEPYLDDLLKSKKTFQQIAIRLIRIRKMEKCLADMGEQAVVRYDPRRNSDQLYRMVISHDTMLEYAKKMLERHEPLRRIFVDIYPCVFIDEYQDTSQDVLSIIKCLIDYSRKLDKQFLAGFFGDRLQMIYSGDQRSIDSFAESMGIEHVEKPFNRRSCKEILDVGNAIRNDSIVQESIFEDCSGGSCTFFVAESDADITDIMQRIQRAMEIDISTAHVLHLTNEAISLQSGFGELYSTLKDSSYYKTHFDRLNGEFLNNDENKMGEAIRILYEVAARYAALNQGESLVRTVLGQQSKHEEYGKLVEFFMGMPHFENGTTLREYLVWLSDYCSKDGSFPKMVTDLVGGIEADCSLVDTFRAALLKGFHFTEGEDDGESLQKSVDSLLDTSMNEYTNWISYLEKDAANEAHNHTFHGVKGREFDSVIALARNTYSGKSRGNKTYFDLFFGKDLQDLGDDERKKYEKARNLLYVAVTRAKKNFILVYLDDISAYQDKIESIFGKVKRL